MTGSGMSSVNQNFNTSREGTPSTQTSETPEKLQADLNQWIKVPAGLGILGQ